VLDFIEKPGFVIVLLVALVVFGSKRLPDSARALGRSMRILKAEAKGLKDDDKPAAAPVEAQALPPGTAQAVPPAAEQTQQHQP
jgi:sec-independent protein translocase protein TatA